VADWLWPERVSGLFQPPTSGNNFWSAHCLGWVRLSREGITTFSNFGEVALIPIGCWKQCSVPMTCDKDFRSRMPFWGSCFHCLLEGANPSFLFPCRIFVTIDAVSSVLLNLAFPINVEADHWSYSPFNTGFPFDLRNFSGQCVLWCEFARHFHLCIHFSWFGVRRRPLFFPLVFSVTRSPNRALEKPLLTLVLRFWHGNLNKMQLIRQLGFLCRDYRSHWLIVRLPIVWYKRILSLSIYGAQLR